MLVLNKQNRKKRKTKCRVYLKGPDAWFISIVLFDFGVPNLVQKRIEKAKVINDMR